MSSESETTEVEVVEEEPNPSSCRIEDLSAFRLDGDFATRSRIRRVRRPRLYATKDLKDNWFHINPLDDSACWISVVQDAANNLHLVVDAMRAMLKDHIGYGRVRTIVTTQGVAGLWWLPKRWAHKAPSSWNESALQIAEEQAGTCIRVGSVGGGMSIWQATVAETGTAAEPQWLDVPLTRQLEQVFFDRIITGPDHPVVLHLLQRGGR